MFTAMLRAQWFWSRAILSFFLAAAFALPLGAVVVTATFGSEFFYAPSMYLDVGETVGSVTAILFCAAGIAIALQDWSADDRGRHIYALSLPIDRRRYLANRAGGALFLLALVAIALAAGGAVATMLIELPDSLGTYPVSLAARALLSAWLAYALAFAVRFGAGRRAGIAFLSLLALIVALGLLPVFAPGSREWLRDAVRGVTSHPGPLGILFGRWSFIDV